MVWREAVVLVEEEHVQQFGVIGLCGIVPALFRAELRGEISVEGEVYKYTGWSRSTTYIPVMELQIKTRIFS